MPVLGIQSESAPFAHNVSQFFAFEVAPQVLAEEFKSLAGAVLGSASAVRGDNQVGSIPEQTIWRHRFYFGHVQSGASDFTVLQRID